jgi:hypothetical protein
VIKKAKDLKMTPEPGPEVEGYVPKSFVDAVPGGGRRKFGMQDSQLILKMQHSQKKPQLRKSGRSRRRMSCITSSHPAWKWASSKLNRPVLRTSFTVIDNAVYPPLHKKTALVEPLFLDNYCSMF